MATKSGAPAAGRKKLALVCTKGGHFEQMTNLSDFFEQYDHFWITNQNTQTESQLKKERKYYIETAHFKRPWTYLSQITPVIKIFRQERPTHVLSTGSGRTAFVPFLLSRLLNVKFLYIDTFSRVRGHSKFGTFLIKTRSRIYSQWEDGQNAHADYIGPIFKPQEAFQKKADANYVFITVGTRDEPFTRLLRAVEDLIEKGVIREKVIVQAGHTKYSSNRMELFDFCKPEKIDDLILNARYVITQESAGHRDAMPEIPHAVPGHAARLPVRRAAHPERYERGPAFAPRGAGVYRRGTNRRRTGTGHRCHRPLTDRISVR